MSIVNSIKHNLNSRRTHTRHTKKIWLQKYRASRTKAIAQFFVNLFFTHFFKCDGAPLWGPSDNVGKFCSSFYNTNFP